MTRMTICNKSVTSGGAGGQVRRYNFSAMDDGGGYILGSGSVDYVTGDIALPVLPEIAQSVWSSEGAWGSSGGSDSIAFTSGVVTCRYVPAGADDEPLSEEVAAPGVTLQILPAELDETIVPGSLCFTAGGSTYVDREGILYRDPSSETGSGFPCGTVNYLSGSIVLTDLGAGLANFTIISMLTKYGNYTATGAVFRTAVVPLVPQSVSVSAVAEDGTNITATSNQDGDLVGEWALGKVNYQYGVAALLFGKEVAGTWTPLKVDPATVKYSAVAYKYLPLDASIVGIDAVRLPSDGRLPVFRPGDFAVIGHTAKEIDTYSNSQQIDLGRARLSRVRITDADGVVLDPAADYSANLDTGIVTMGTVSGFTQPLTIEHRVEDLALVSDAQLDGSLTFTRALTHEYPAPGSYVSSCAMGGDLKSRVSVFFDQLSWDQTSWADAVSGNEAAATYNNILYPPLVTNLGAVTERWALRFTSSTAFEVIGEHFGKIATGTISEDCTPINPATQTPFFTVRAAGWGSGWVIGNIVRLNTVGAMLPLWLVRTIRQGPEAGIDYTFELLARGSVDRP